MTTIWIVLAVFLTFALLLVWLLMTKLDAEHRLRVAKIDLAHANKLLEAEKKRTAALTSTVGNLMEHEKKYADRIAELTDELHRRGKA